MSYENLPDPRPMSVRLMLGPMPKAIAVLITIGLAGLCIAGIVCLFFGDNREIRLGSGAVALVTGMLATLYGLAISWSDYHKTWPKRRTLRRHRSGRRTAGAR